MKALYAPRFWLDLGEGMDYLAVKAGDTLALRWQEAVEGETRFLREHPYSGRARHDLPLPGIRTWSVGGFRNWLIFCEVDDAAKAITFLRVKHGAMQLARLFPPSQAEGGGEPR